MGDFNCAMKFKLCWSFCFIALHLKFLVEFDKFLEEHKQELAEKNPEEGDASKMQENEFEIEQADQQVREYLINCCVCTCISMRTKT